MSDPAIYVALSGEGPRRLIVEGSLSLLTELLEAVQLESHRPASTDDLLPIVQRLSDSNTLSQAPERGGVRQDMPAAPAE